MKKIISKIPVYKLFRTFGYPKIMPISYTLGLTYRCNSRCMTCNIYEKEADELSLEEYRKIFHSLGKSPYWITFSGGEPFLRPDIADIAESLYSICHPKIINIPTNGILWRKIPGKVREILERCPDVNLTVNLSLDNVGESHDKIRGIKGNFEKAIKTYQALRAIDHPNFTLGIHTVISRYNVNDFARVYEKLLDLRPDSYITEIAEEREELGTIGTGITPTAEEYGRAVNIIIDNMKNKKTNTENKRKRVKTIALITRSFRLEYYNMVKQYLLNKKQLIPCYAGFMSIQIAPNGDVWTCCVKAEVMGNLRKLGYDFKKVWYSPESDKIREGIRKKLCHCPLANVSYTNMLCHLPTLCKISMRVLMGKV